MPDLSLVMEYPAVIHLILIYLTYSEKLELA